MEQFPTYCWLNQNLLHIFTVWGRIDPFPLPCLHHCYFYNRIMYETYSITFKLIFTYIRNLILAIQVKTQVWFLLLFYWAEQAKLLYYTLAFFLHELITPPERLKWSAWNSARTYRNQLWEGINLKCSKLDHRTLPYGPLKFQYYLNIRNILFGLITVCWLIYSC
jgi:hypothetical protein